MQKLKKLNSIPSSSTPTFWILDFPCHNFPKKFIILITKRNDCESLLLGGYFFKLIV